MAVATKTRVQLSPSEMSLLRIAAVDPKGSVLLRQVSARENAGRLIRQGLGKLEVGDSYGVDFFVINDEGRALVR